MSDEKKKMTPEEFVKAHEAFCVEHGYEIIAVPFPVPVNRGGVNTIEVGVRYEVRELNKNPLN